ncbi:MAG: Gfo/Idh/MocA family oxidoreductase, partial [Chloroflexota bacterium]
LAPLVEVRAVCSRRRERLEGIRAELGLPDAALEQEWQRLVERPDVDLVVNTAPDNLHHPITLAAIARGKHVFCEKPLAMRAAQAREMLDIAEAAGVAHFTGFTWRFAPPMATIRRLLNAGALGEVRFIDGHFRIGPPLAGKEWQFDPEQRAGGVLGNLGVHLIDLARYLTSPPAPGSEVERGNASRQVGHDAGLRSPSLRGKGPGGRSHPLGWRVWARCDAISRPPAATGGHTSGVNDLVWLQVAMGGGPEAPQARLQASQLLTLRAADPVRLEVHGTAASAVGYANPLAPERQRVTCFSHTSDLPERVEPLEFPGGPPAPPTAALPSGGLLRPTIRHLYEAHIVPRLTRGHARPDTPTFYDGWLAQRVMDAALESAERGLWVDT